MDTNSLLNESAGYNKKMSELCAVLIGHLEENKRELISREVD